MAAASRPLQRFAIRLFHASLLATKRFEQRIVRLLTRPFSIADTSKYRLAGRKSFMSLLPVVVGRHLDNQDEKFLFLYAIYDPILLAQRRAARLSPLAGLRPSARAPCARRA